MCDCGEDCDDVPLTAAGVRDWGLRLVSTGKGRAVTRALGCGFDADPVGFNRTIQSDGVG